MVKIMRTTDVSANNYIVIEQSKSHKTCVCVCWSRHIDGKSEHMCMLKHVDAARARGNAHIIMLCLNVCMCFTKLETLDINTRETHVCAHTQHFVYMCVSVSHAQCPRTAFTRH